jgi:hypothetical protein
MLAAFKYSSILRRSKRKLRVACGLPDAPSSTGSISAEKAGPRAIPLRFGGLCVLLRKRFGIFKGIHRMLMCLPGKFVRGEMIAFSVGGSCGFVGMRG